MLTLIGTEYGAENVFDLTKMQPYNLEMLYKSFTKYSSEVVLYLPRNSDLNQIARYAKDGKKLEVAHYAIMGASKVGSDTGTVCVLWRLQI
jgi:trimethylguanosine synthase